MPNVFVSTQKATQNYLLLNYISELHVFEPSNYKHFCGLCIYKAQLLLKLVQKTTFLLSQYNYVTSYRLI